MSRNIVFEGWLTKSPPAKRIWRTKWRRRWFALRQSGELPGQYFLDYYADRNCRRLKGTINLDLCEQVDAGLHMERTSHDSLDPKLRGSVFTIQTQSRTYHLEADCESDMEKWVDAICRVCGLRATDVSTNLDVHENIFNTISTANDSLECASGTGPYIPISECITGVKTQDNQRAFTFDPKNIVVSTRTPFDHVPMNRHHQMYLSQPHIRLNNAEFSENDSNLSDEECKSLNASQTNMKEWAVTKSFTKLAISPQKNGFSDNGPPIPPRPPKTFAPGKEVAQKEIPQPSEPRRMSYGGALPSPGRSVTSRATDDEEECSPGHSLMQYCNLSSLPSSVERAPPAVDRALKPRYSSHSIGQIHNPMGQTALHLSVTDDIKTDDLQYLDLDLHSSKPTSTTKTPDLPRSKMNKVPEKSQMGVDIDSTYKTVDFLKTEAFNITRKDAEASRSNQL